MTANEQVRGRVFVSRDLVIRGSSGPLLPTLDVAYLKRRIEVTSNATLTLERLFIANPRQPSAVSSSGLDLVMLQPDSMLILRDVVLSYSLCAPFNFTAKYSRTIPRPEQLPGSQNVSILTGFCPPVAASITAAIARSCLAEAFLMMDFAIAGFILGLSGVRINIGSVAYYNTTYFCTHVVPSDCVISRGLPVCTSEAVASYGMVEVDTYDLYAQPPAAAVLAGGGHGGGSVSRRELAVILATVLGAAALKVPEAGDEAATAVDIGVVERYGGGRQDSSVSSSGAAVPSGTARGAVSATSTLAYEAAAVAMGPTSAAHCELVRSATGISMPGGGGLGGLASLDPPLPLDSLLPQRVQSSGPLLDVASAVTKGIVAPGCAAAAVASSDNLSSGGGNSRGGGGHGGRSAAVNLNMVLGVDVEACREAVLGRGAFATVLQGALDGRPVAVKLYHRDAIGGSAEEMCSVKQEIAILARCHHPNVVQLLGAGSSASGSELFLVEELMATNLSRACHGDGGLTLPRVLAIARDIAAGLSYLHPTVIHRDLKPANVLLDDSGTAKLSDFGLSRLWSSTVLTANPEAGTVQYMVALAVGFHNQRLRLPEGEHPRFHPKLRKLILQCWEQVRGDGST
ncbi:hypothetical protein GPECTOR_31g324 [Gonium pectorale]|uniref:Protein kinase domain-containing protein n=1 Tax=Gonium pectorale TaxID=33097 RepID=A0A150GDP6_GONPE|nr:hypothetical protein GPECTOR_31g324 [Gonium pectorale]|eukprot:KXZ47962.1 hypothetical protein GPECTOR_31g324 [Gonium pectorale]